MVTYDHCAAPDLRAPPWHAPINTSHLAGPSPWWALHAACSRRLLRTDPPSCRKGRKPPFQFKHRDSATLEGVELGRDVDDGPASLGACAGPHQCRFDRRQLVQHLLRRHARAKRDSGEAGEGKTKHGGKGMQAKRCVIPLV